MANVEKAFSELLDVVTHLVHTNRTWNQDLSHAEAVAKLDAARLHVVATDVADVTQDVETGDAAGGVQDGIKTVGDVVNVVKSGE